MEPKNETVFVIFMSKALHFNEFPLVSFKGNSILMENGRKTRQWHYQFATLGDRDARGGLGSHIVLQI